MTDQTSKAAASKAAAEARQAASRATAEKVNAALRRAIRPLTMESNAGTHGVAANANDYIRGLAGRDVPERATAPAPTPAANPWRAAPEPADPGALAAAIAEAVGVAVAAATLRGDGLTGLDPAPASPSPTADSGLGPRGIPPAAERPPGAVNAWLRSEAARQRNRR